MTPSHTCRFIAGTLIVIAGQLPAAAGQSAPADSRVPLDAIRDSAQQVMERADFHSVRRRVLEQIPTQDMDRGFLRGLMESIARGIADLLTWLLPTPRNPAPVTSSGKSGTFLNDFDFARAGTIVVVLIVAGLLIWLVAHIIKRHQQDPQRAGVPGISETGVVSTVPPGEQAASAYESRALEYASRYDFSAAIRELLLGSMSWIERAGLIRFRKGLTNHDYVRAVWGQEHRRSAYLVTGSQFDLVFFGRRTATSEMFELCLTAFQGAFCEETATACDEG